MKYLELIKVLHTNNTRYGDTIYIIYPDSSISIGKYMNCDDAAIYFTDNTSVPLRDIQSVRVVK